MAWTGQTSEFFPFITVSGRPTVAKDPLLMMGQLASQDFVIRASNDPGQQCSLNVQKPELRSQGHQVAAIFQFLKADFYCRHSNKPFMTKARTSCINKPSNTQIWMLLHLWPSTDQYRCENDFQRRV